jgi:hypothetical protein
MLERCAHGVEANHRDAEKLREHREGPDRSRAGMAGSLALIQARISNGGLR